jgi:DNA-binding MarR family transcriptional regulator
MNARVATVSVDGGRWNGGRTSASATDVELLNKSIGYMLRRAQLAVFADFGESLAELGLRPAQFGVLSVLDRNPGITQSRVCTALGIQHANFVSIIGSLERRGLVQRASSATDRRSKSLSLTTAGRRVLDSASELQRLHETRIGQRLGPGGSAELLRLLDRLMDFG